MLPISSELGPHFARKVFLAPGFFMFLFFLFLGMGMWKKMKAKQNLEITPVWARIGKNSDFEKPNFQFFCYENCNSQLFSEKNL
jgi:hypothetical protein